MGGMEGMEDMPISYDARLVDGKAARGLKELVPGEPWLGRQASRESLV
jgi:hypothetical protein